MYITAGGAGGGSHNSDDAQGGGGAGATCIKIIAVTDLQQTTTLSVGAGGAGGTGNRPSSGGDGQPSSFGDFCTAAGGKKVPTWGIGGEGGTVTRAKGTAMKIKGTRAAFRLGLVCFRAGKATKHTRSPCDSVVPRHGCCRLRD